MVALQSNMIVTPTPQSNIKGNVTSQSNDTTINAEASTVTPVTSPEKEKGSIEQVTSGATETGIIITATESTTTTTTTATTAATTTSSSPATTKVKSVTKNDTKVSTDRPYVSHLGKYFVYTSTRTKPENRMISPS